MNKVKIISGVKVGNAMRISPSHCICGRGYLLAEALERFPEELAKMENAEKKLKSTVLYCVACPSFMTGAEPCIDGGYSIV
jgi:hypothetical protein